jgi:hypothetical protein
MPVDAAEVDVEELMRRIVRLRSPDIRAMIVHHRMARLYGDSASGTDEDKFWSPLSGHLARTVPVSMVLQ